MGRPPLNYTLTTVRLPDVDKIDAVLKPKEKRAAFIREAVELLVEMRTKAKGRRKRGAAGH